MSAEFQSQPPRPLRTSGRILVVDDDAVARLIIQRWMQHWDLEAELYASPAAAIAQFTHFDFDLAIIDFHLPGMDGLELIEKIRLTTRHQGTREPVLALHTTDGDVRERARTSGVHYFLQKPVNSSELLLVVKESGCRPRARDQEVANINRTTQLNVNLRPRPFFTIPVR